MATAPQAHKDPAGPSLLAGRSNLTLRIASSAVLAPLAIATAYFGGTAFATFWLVASLGVLWEWNTLVCGHDRNSVLTIGAVALIGGGLLLAFGWAGTAITFVILGAFGVAALASRIRRAWCSAGLLYAAALLIAPVMLRADQRFGFAAILFLFVVVWLTDIVAYFVGRAVGGPRLMPRVSPNKTWSGALGGTVAGVAGGLAVARYFSVDHLVAVGIVALALSVVAQTGDLAESAIKRRFNTKDASSLIPGHGGLMDRLDGFLAAVLVATVLGLLHGGLAAPARGLMIW